jgi:hypothetical protein
MSNKYLVKVSDSNGLSANVVYDRAHSLHKVEYFNRKDLVGTEWFNTQFEATKSAQHFINGDFKCQ